MAEQRGWDVVKVYEDAGVSGAKARDQRPAFYRMATDAAKGRINMIAIWALDRLGRSGRDVINFISDLPEQGVALTAPRTTRYVYACRQARTYDNGSRCRDGAHPDSRKD